MLRSHRTQLVGHTSRCIVVLSVLLDDYTIVYACYWSFSFKNPKHLYTFLSYVFKSCIGFVLSYCVNVKKNTFGIRNTQYSIALNVHKQSSIFTTTYTIQCRVNCLNKIIFKELKNWMNSHRSRRCLMIIKV